jgi:hypothetical protein
MGDHFVDFSLPRLLVPFSIEYKTHWVGLGQVGFYIWVIAALSFYVRRWIGQKTWRLIHYANFATFIMGWLHGIFSGTDSGLSWVRWYYWISGGSLLILLAYRVHGSVWKKISLIPPFLRKRVQALSQISNKSKATPVVPAEKRIPEALFREQAVSTVSSMDKTIMPVITLSTPTQTTSQNSAHGRQDEKTRPRTSEMPAAENQSQLSVDSPRVAATLPVSEVQPMPESLVKKYEMGTGKNKINVRIFREPPTEPIPVESQEAAEINQVDMKTLMLRLKRDLTATPIQPFTPNHTLE